MAQGDLRPMEKNREAVKDLKSIIEIRTPLYKRAAAQLDTSGRDEDFSARGLEALCRQFLG